jgi:Arc-like DNA binding domain
VLYKTELHFAIARCYVLFMTRTDPQINIRIPLVLKEQLGVAARANTRTMNAEIVQRLEASFKDELWFVVKKNTAEADMIWELQDSMQGLKAEVAELRTNLTKVIGGVTDPEMAGVPDFTEEGRAILQTRHMVTELLESFKAMTKPTRHSDRNKRD